jgi:methylated-DNA-[protein]-cysteine S-methyltransferase
MTQQEKQVWIGVVRDTELGDIWTAVSPNGLVAINLWGEQERFVAQVTKLTGVVPEYDEAKTAEIAQQLRQYLNKERTDFTMPIDWSVMSDFQQSAMQAVCDIPYGQVRTYMDIANLLGKPKAIRAVGRANATNPMPIVVPCHRVHGSDGKLHGYSAPGGLETKAWLLQLEGSWLL